ncbi:MAG: tRNA preQ1(34) S-adenosylmethionine ribosyltransferase-isomerase QueA [Thermodesulfobacteriota bacterium]
MELKDFDYVLPEGLVARYPLERRDASRLLSLDRSSGRITHGGFSGLPSLLRRGDLLVLNDTEVIPARLRGVKATGGRVEFLLVERLEADGGDGLWRCLVRPAKALGSGRKVSFGSGISAVVRASEGNGFIIAEFRGLTEKALNEAGLVPIPPYMGREPVEIDKQRYQTVFAANKGAVAAPTAGLHFTEPMIKALEEKGVEVRYITLHTGPATFLPVREDDIERISLGEESYSISPLVWQAVMRAVEENRRVIAVGTTTVRALESAARGGLERPVIAGRTGLFIRPGFEFRLIDGLITNFHLPRSTLLMLTAAFGGYGHIMKAYGEAVAEGYRFYSYGDAMFIY